MHHRATSRRKKRARNENLVEEIMMENFSNLVNEVDIQVQEAQRVPNKMNPKRPTARHIIIKRLKKTRGVKSNKRKAINYLQESSPTTVS